MRRLFLLAWLLAGCTADMGSVGEDAPLPYGGKADQIAGELTFVLPLPKPYGDASCSEARITREYETRYNESRRLGEGLARKACLAAGYAQCDDLRVEIRRDDWTSSCQLWTTVFPAGTRGDAPGEFWKTAELSQPYGDTDCSRQQQMTDLAGTRERLAADAMRECTRAGWASCSTLVDGYVLPPFSYDTRREGTVETTKASPKRGAEGRCQVGVIVIGRPATPTPEDIADEPAPEEEWSGDESGAGGASDYEEPVE